MKQNRTAAAAPPVRKNKGKNRDRQTRSLCVAGGCLLWSTADHCMAYRILGPAAQGEGANLPAAIAAGLLFLLGAACLLAAVFVIRPARPWRRCRKRLCYLGAGYLGVQLLISLAAGAFAWCLGYFTGLPEEHVKTGADLLCGILQVPLRGAVLILALQILAGSRGSSRAVWARGMAASALYTLCQSLLTLWQGGIPVQAARILLSAGMTWGLWVFLYDTCQKEAAKQTAEAPTDSRNHTDSAHRADSRNRTDSRSSHRQQKPDRQRKPHRSYRQTPSNRKDQRKETGGEPR